MSFPDILILHLAVNRQKQYPCTKPKKCFFKKRKKQPVLQTPTKSRGWLFSFLWALIFSLQNTGRCSTAVHKRCLALLWGFSVQVHLFSAEHTMGCQPQRPQKAPTPPIPSPSALCEKRGWEVQVHDVSCADHPTGARHLPVTCFTYWAARTRLDEQWHPVLLQGTARQGQSCGASPAPPGHHQMFTIAKAGLYSIHRNRNTASKH